MDYAIKWVEARAFKTNMTIIISKFFYGCILIRFRCPHTLVLDQGVHFINDIITYLVDHFLFRNTTSTTQYPQGNNQVKSTNKVIGTTMTKLVNVKFNDWDEHLSVVLYAYHATFKVTTSHTPFQLVYGLHPFMPT